MKREILRIQEAGLIPGTFKMVSHLDEKGSQIKEKLKSARLNLTAETIGFLPDLNISSRLTFSLTPTKNAFWTELLKIAVDAIPDDRIDQLPLDCPQAIKYAISLKRVPKNFAKRSQQLEVRQQLESPHDKSPGDRHPLFFSTNICWLPHCGRFQGAAVIRGDSDNLKFWQTYFKDNHRIDAKKLARKGKNYLIERLAIDKAFDSTEGDYLLLDCPSADGPVMDLLKSLDLATPKIPPESYLDLEHLAAQDTHPKFVWDREPSWVETDPSEIRMMDDFVGSYRGYGVRHIAPNQGLIGVSVTKGNQGWSLCTECLVYPGDRANIFADEEWHTSLAKDWINKQIEENDKADRQHQISR